MPQTFDLSKLQETLLVQGSRWKTRSLTYRINKYPPSLNKKERNPWKSDFSVNVDFGLNSVSYFMFK